MKFFLTLFGLIAISAIGYSSIITKSNDYERVHYDGFKVYRVKFTSEEQFKLLLELRNNANEIMFWQLSHMEHYADIMVGPNYRSTFLQMLNKYGFTYKVSIENVEDLNVPNDIFENYRQSYRGYKVYHITFTTDEQFEILRKMQIESGTNSDFTFWQLCHSRKFADIMVSPSKIIDLFEFLDKYNYTYECIIEDVEEILSIVPKQFEEKRKSYRGYKIYEVQFTTEKQFQILLKMRIESGINDISVLQLSRGRKMADIMVGPSQNLEFLQLLKAEDFSYRCVCEDVEEKLKGGEESTVDKVSYKGYKVYHVTFTTEEQFNILYKMRIESGSKDISFWQLCHTRKFADVMVAPTKNIEFVQFLDNNNFSYEITINDLEEHIKNQ